ncbi:reverse transcriptase domain-containing protein [Tanacetum coccineum]
MGFPLKCFLDAYKGYHHVRMAEEDEEKTAFYTDQDMYCYTKMPFGLKNAGATYQRLVDGAFQSQIGKNLEVCVDDMVVKSKTLHDAERNYALLEKMELALRHASRRLRRYFEAHPITVITDQPIKQILNNADTSGRMAQYSVELGAYNIMYEPRSAIKGQILANFINEILVSSEAVVPRQTQYTIDHQKDYKEEWVLYTDGASSVKGAGAGLVLISPTKMEYTYALRLNFESTNNQAEYEALLAGLRIAKKMGVQSLFVNVDSKLVASQINENYEACKENMIRYLSKAKDSKTSKFKTYPKTKTKRQTY